MFSWMTTVPDLTGFDSAGLMGAMWLWERRVSRLREEQITECHGRIMREEQKLTALTDVLERNTAAFSRFAESQRQLDRAINNLAEELRHAQRGVADWFSCWAWPAAAVQRPAWS